MAQHTSETGLWESDLELIWKLPSWRLALIVYKVAKQADKTEMKSITIHLQSLENTMINMAWYLKVCNILGLINSYIILFKVCQIGLNLFPVL